MTNHLSLATAETPAQAVETHVSWHGNTTMEMEDDDAQEGGPPCWIVPTEQPHDFHCLSGKYQKLGTNVISMQD